MNFVAMINKVILSLKVSSESAEIAISHGPTEIKLTHTFNNEVSEGQSSHTSRKSPKKKNKKKSNDPIVTNANTAVVIWKQNHCKIHTHTKVHKVHKNTQKYTKTQKNI